VVPGEHLAQCVSLDAGGVDSATTSTNVVLKEDNQLIGVLAPARDIKTWSALIAGSDGALNSVPLAINKQATPNSIVIWPAGSWQPELPVSIYPNQGGTRFLVVQRNSKSPSVRLALVAYDTARRTWVRESCGELCERVTNASEAAPVFASSGLENVGLMEQANDKREVAVIAMRNRPDGTSFATVRVPGGSRAALATQSGASQLWILPSDLATEVEVRDLTSGQDLPWEGCH
jgi:hypothetical protein